MYFQQGCGGSDHRDLSFLAMPVDIQFADIDRSQAVNHVAPLQSLRIIECQIPRRFSRHARGGIGGSFRPARDHDKQVGSQ
ncbi:MAG: hypothetical protein ACD_75C00455G0003 [uncultured bacterium]|nr:MAG: hypothetical protein ACD_75C00455G0003 [uncultured bacterium]